MPGRNCANVVISLAPSGHTARDKHCEPSRSCAGLQACDAFFCYFFFRFGRGADECTHHYRYLGRTEMGKRNVFLLLLGGPLLERRPCGRVVALRGGTSTIFASSSFLVVRFSPLLFCFVDVIFKFFLYFSLNLTLSP